MSSNTWVNGEIPSWRSDYYKFKGLTFVQVLPQKVVSTEHSTCTDNVFSKINNVAQYVKPKSEVISQIHTNRRAKVSGEAETSHNAGINRYDLLIQGDGIILCHPSSTNLYALNDQGCATHDEMRDNKTKPSAPDLKTVLNQRLKCKNYL